MGLHHPSPSPSMLLPAPSPSAGPMSVPTPSPNPSGAAQAASHGPASAMAALGRDASHPSPFFHAECSPAPIQSPWANAGSPGMPRPSPATGRVGHSPGGHVINFINNYTLVHSHFQIINALIFVL